MTGWRYEEDLRGLAADLAPNDAAVERAFARRSRWLVAVAVAAAVVAVLAQPEPRPDDGDGWTLATDGVRIRSAGDGRSRSTSHRR
jgi:hypothetical protein